MVDLGAAWVHGTVNNPLMNMLEHYGIDYIEHPEMKSSNAAITDISADGTRTAWTAKDLESLMPLVAECVPTLKPGVW